MRREQSERRARNGEWGLPKGHSDHGESEMETALRETAEENGLVDEIRFEHFVTAASWSSADARWTVEVDDRAVNDPMGFACRSVGGRP